MKSKEQLKENYVNLRESDIDDLNSVIADINGLIEQKKITEDSVRILGNIEAVISGHKDDFLWRLLRIAKQGHMID